jgi:hypothetical protein
MWIEQGFKTVKSAGSDSEHFRITEPDRAERIWLIYALSSLWFHAVASTVEVKPDDIASVFPPQMQVALTAFAKEYQQQRPRSLRLYQQGRLMLLVMIMLQQPLSIPTMLAPEPLPMSRKT